MYLHDERPLLFGMNRTHVERSGGGLHGTGVQLSVSAPTWTARPHAAALRRSGRPGCVSKMVIECLNVHSNWTGRRNQITKHLLDPDRRTSMRGGSRVERARCAGGFAVATNAMG